MTANGEKILALAKTLFPICRSITGDGVRQTLKILSQEIPLEIHEVPTGTKVCDWSIPKEWNIRSAFIANEKGEIIVDFKNHNLHIVSYSIPVDKWLTLSELEEHLYSLPEQPNAIPYVTSYYKERWGFCLTHEQRSKLQEGNYHVFIDSDLKEGYLSYGEYFIKGQSDEEVFLSTYICHPSMANNELSGPSVAVFIAKWLASAPRKYSYRIVFTPETIGSITYLSRHLEELRKNVKLGFNLTCMGDERDYSYVASPYGATLADKIINNVLKHNHPDFTQYSFLDRGSDERQYCSPGVDLPLVTLCRSKFGTYDEYHTSLDNFDLVTAKGLQGSYELLQDCIEVNEANKIYKLACCGEPQLGKRGLYPNLSTKDMSVETIINLVAYANGSNDLIDISNFIEVPVKSILPIAKKLFEAGLLEVVD